MPDDGQPKHPHNMPEAIRLARLIGGTVDRDKLIGRLALCAMPRSSFSMISRSCCSQSTATKRPRKSADETAENQAVALRAAL
jgi:hypothetical protein